MRIETRQVTVEQEVYIAEDGAEFDDEDDCEAYENALVGQRLKMYDYNEMPCDSLGECWYVKLDTQEEINSFMTLCDYMGVHRSGIKEPGVYMYTEGTGCTWTNISEVIKSIEESEDYVSGN